MPCDRRLSAPDPVIPEVENVLWKRVLRGELQSEEGNDILRDFLRLPIDLHDSRHLLPLAWHVAEEIGETICGSEYVTLAILQKVPLVTADRKLYRAVKDSPFSDSVLWIQDLTMG